MKGKQYDTNNVYIKFVEYEDEILIVQYTENLYGNYFWGLTAKILIKNQFCPITYVSHGKILFSTDKIEVLKRYLYDTFQVEIPYNLLSNIEKQAILAKLIC
jgi:hypothetical protein